MAQIERRAEERAPRKKVNVPVDDGKIADTISPVSRCFVLISTCVIYYTACILLYYSYTTPRVVSSFVIMFHIYISRTRILRYTVLIIKNTKMVLI